MSETGWRPTAAYVRSAVGAVSIIAFALVWRRPDLLVIAAPMAVMTVWSILTRPRGDADASWTNSDTRSCARATPRRGAPRSRVSRRSTSPPRRSTPHRGRRRVRRAGSPPPARTVGRSTSNSVCDRRGGVDDRSTASVSWPPPLGGVSLAHRHGAALVGHASTAGDLRLRRVGAPVGRIDRSAPIGTVRGRERVRRCPAISNRRSSPPDQLGAIGAIERTSGQLDVGRSRHPRRARDRCDG